MALKTFKPTTPSQRSWSSSTAADLWKGKPVKALTEGLTKSGGRNNTGRITDAGIGRRSQADLPHGRFQADARSTCRRRSSGWNTIRTGRPSSR